MKYFYVASLRILLLKLGLVEKKIKTANVKGCIIY